MFSHLILYFFVFFKPSIAKLVSGEEQERVFLHHNTAVVDAVELYEHKHQRREQCFSRFHQLRDECPAMVMEQDEDGLTCKYFNELPEKTKLTNETVDYVTRQKGFCSGFCQQNPCEPCKCAEMCGEQVNDGYFCDCINVAQERKKNCLSIMESGYKTNGRYEIDPDGAGKFPVHCQMQHKEYTNPVTICNSTRANHGAMSGFTTERGFQSEGECKDNCWKEYQGDDKYNLAYWRPKDKFCHCMIDAKKPLKTTTNDVYVCFWIWQPVYSQWLFNGMILMFLRTRAEDGRFWQKTYEEFKIGFGVANNIWLGLEQIHRITTAFDTDMKIVMVTERNYKVTTAYQGVRVKNGDDKYGLSAESFDPMNANELSPIHFHVNGYDERVFQGNLPFEKCKNSFWWVCGSKIPVAFEEDGFGLHVKAKSIAIYLVTKDKE